MSEKKDITHFIERLGAFEDRLGVRLKVLVAYVSDGYLTIHGEVHPYKQATIKPGIEVHVAAYDSSGRLIATSGTSLSEEASSGFQAFELGVDLSIEELFKIRVFPKANMLFVLEQRRHDVVRKFEALVVGIKYHRGHVDDLTTGNLVRLVREPDNIHDSNAVQVKLLTGELLGYIPRELAVTLAKELDAGMNVQAQISHSLRKSVQLAISVGEAQLDMS